MKFMDLFTPAKGVGRESVARVQIPRSPPKNTGNHRFPVFLRFIPAFLFTELDILNTDWDRNLQLFTSERRPKMQCNWPVIVLFPLNSH